MTEHLHDKFEYLVETTQRRMLVGQTYTNENMQDDLNKRGQEGWELVTTAGGTVEGVHYMQCIWKRKILETKQ